MTELAKLTTALGLEGLRQPLLHVFLSETAFHRRVHSLLRVHQNRCREYRVDIEDGLEFLMVSTRCPQEAHWLVPVAFYH
jgi:hypothetical protein